MKVEMFGTQKSAMPLSFSNFDFLPIYRADSAGSRTYPLHTFQHGHAGYLGSLQKMSGLNDTNCSDKFVFFLISRATKSTKGCQILDLRQSKLFEKIQCHFHFLILDSGLILYRHPLEIYPDYVISH